METIKLNTLDEVQAFIDNANSLLGFPDDKSDTLTYCNVPEITEVKDEDSNVVESYYEVVVTNELNAKLNPEINEQPMQ